MINLQHKKILITGANGFVGSNAVYHFEKLNAHITAVVSPHALPDQINQKLGDIKKNIVIKTANLLSPQEAMMVTKNQDIVLHFASIDGNTEYKKKYSAEIFSKNIRMVLNMLEAAVHQHVKTFLLVSSTDIYTPSNHRLITENSPLDIHWDKNVDGYKLAKWAIELAAREFSKQYNLNIIVLRPSNLYGTRDEFENTERMRVIPTMIKRIFETNESIVLWTKKDQKKSFLYIDDFLCVCQQMIEKEVYNLPVNVASNYQITLGELAEKIILLTNKKRKVIIDKKKAISAVSRKFNLSRLQKLLPTFHETELSDGLKKTIDFYQNHYTQE